MKLADLVRRLPDATLTGNSGLEVQGIALDSRSIRPGWIFAALPGQNSHGLDFLDRALEAGAAAVLTDQQRPNGVEVAWVTAPSPRSATAAAAWTLAGDPQEELRMLAITGTNGKGTTAYLISLVLATAGQPTALIGTLGAQFPDGSEVPLDRTTPEATDLAPLFRRAVDVGAAALAMEVSSHALAQDRLAGLRFDVGVWTNLSRDHLDYHGDMESYFEAKRRLFTDHLVDTGRRVLPVDDQWGARLLDEPREGDVSWGLDRGAVCAREVQSDLEGTSFVLRLPNAEVAVQLPMIGVHNLRNAIAAAATAHAVGVNLQDIRRGLNQARPLVGRMERVDVGTDFPVFVDFAHTPEGLRSVLQALRKITDRRLIVVFGAGGHRDQGKRGPMGYAVGELADLAVVTSDNPRCEDPEKIAEVVADGARAAGAEPVVILDRRKAIATALEQADSRSLVLVAGKGHEAYQTIGDRQIPFSDQAVLREEAGRMSCE
jgi:UDP-N-acetylmuramoyl-L-alanyl-D-glutamate--2,6-diaminopimelate ligase